MDSRQKVTVDMAQEFNHLYSQGLTYEHIAHKYKLSVCTIGRYIWNPRKCRESVVTKEIGEEILRMRKEHCKRGEITKAVNISESSLSKFLKEQRGN
jgi:DNA invertase Pin-like site-specific DNA recombinase